MKKLLSVTVRGRDKEYCFTFYGDPRHLESWRADGLEVYEVCNVIPVWIKELGLAKPWCFLQDIWNFKWPFKRSYRG